MNVSLLICTHGGQEWADLARDRAYPSAVAQGPLETLLVHEPRSTLAEVRNSAAGLAHGDWLCFLDADDELAPGYLTAMEKAERRKLNHDPLTLNRNEDGLLVPALEHLNPRTSPMIPAWGRPIIEVNCAVIGTLVPRALFEQVGGFHEWPMYEDWELWLRCVTAGARLVPVPEAVYRAHRSIGRNTQPQLSQAVYEEIRALHEHVPALHLPPKET